MTCSVRQENHPPLMVLATLDRGSDAVWIEIDHRILVNRTEFYYKFNHLPCVTSEYLQTVTSSG